MRHLQSPRPQVVSDVCGVDWGDVCGINEGICVVLMGGYVCGVDGKVMCVVLMGGLCE